MLRILRRMAPENRDYLVVYAWGAVWTTWFVVFTPDPLSSLFYRGTVILVACLGVAGAALAIAGMLRNDHLTLERLGVSLMVVQPVGYAVFQLVQTVVDLSLTGTTQRSHLVLLGLWPAFWLWKRYRVLSRRVAEAKETPLPSERVE
ncbi:hypothetical protein EDF28_3610 [Curtobacterium sp. PhB137]|uniref:hypothetical protein n=1 Tax=Curtobacterium sp. PhB137 TaxID=2485182 RepID=UPI000F4DEBE8|nr:hypothetical protein [Curtobacterium sp. PhB137]RPE75665.1 hypothetical protein EDF28_3610 [Curtobacterium sp. PhB137]